MVEIDHHTALERAIKQVAAQIPGLAKGADRDQAEAWVRGARDITTGGGGYFFQLAGGGVLDIPTFGPVLGNGEPHPALEAALNRTDRQEMIIVGSQREDLPVRDCEG